MAAASRKHIVVIGGGITGLAAAHRAVERARETGRATDITLLEAIDRLGGVIHTLRRDDGFLLEAGPDNFITNRPGGIDLVDRLGLSNQLLRTNDAHRRALVVRKGRLVPVPEGFQLMAAPSIWSILTSPIFSPLGKLRMGMEPFIAAKRDGEDESLESFVCRRFGREALDRLIQPMIGGIYGADPRTLSLRATLPRFLEMEAKHGSVVRAMRKQAASTASKEGNGDTGARYSLFVSFDRGMSTLIEALEAAIGRERIRLQTPVARVSMVDGDSPRWSIHLQDGLSLAADALIIAVGAPIAARLLRGVDSDLAADLGAIAYGSAAVVQLAYLRELVAHPLDAFGFVVPAIENRRIIAGSFSSVKYAGRAPAGHVLMRAFLGGALATQILDLDDDAMTAVAREEMSDLLGITGEPLFTRVDRWMNAMPQYTVGHVGRAAAMRARVAKHRGLEVAGNAFEGVGIPDCISDGRAAAERACEAVE